MTQENHAELQAAAQYASIVDMIGACELDYTRLEELSTEDADELAELSTEDADELAELLITANGCESAEDAEERIQDGPLSIQVRGGWVSPGETMMPEDFEILLCTGGPACRIRGELNSYGEPDRAWLEFQDWGTPWTRYYDAEQDILLAYAMRFYFGEGI